MSYVEHVTPADGNVFADLGFPPDEAANLKIRSTLMRTARRLIEERGLKQARAAKLFGVSQPRISELKRGKIDAFTIDSLINMLALAGIVVDLSFREATIAPEPAGEAHVVAEQGAA
ncbi:MAG TPA: helix-turn-helix transcriptional regulator [Longimicrobium sp.]|nr:helix-turn-helix transcriptional regulator [Longimicrobium sp.]